MLATRSSLPATVSRSASATAGRHKARKTFMRYTRQPHRLQQGSPAFDLLGDSAHYRLLGHHPTRTSLTLCTALGGFHGSALARSYSPAQTRRPDCSDGDVAMTMAAKLLSSCDIRTGDRVLTGAQRAQIVDLLMETMDSSKNAIGRPGGGVMASPP